MRVKLTCNPQGTPIGLELDGVPYQVIGEAQCARLEAGAGVVIELDALPVGADETPPTLPPEGAS